ncbi:hypothetical protein, partial [Treponema endosymbiont of Eucomonympha sp.]|uniref:hypothetical protein n=1 Tax=Treponema endosymbiont of Eucomonympha sp. TaxID=1580831 RepID=UPI001E43570D
MSRAFGDTCAAQDGYHSSFLKKLDSKCGIEARRNGGASGIRTYEKATRNTLDLSAIPVLRPLTHLPVIVDPSHALG